MTLPLSIDEQQRLTDGHKALLSAIDKLAKAENDWKLNRRSENFKAAYKKAYRDLIAIGNHELKHIKNQQKQLF